MANFLDTQDITYKMAHTIKEAKSHLVIISPYIKINNQLQAFLQAKTKAANKVDIRLVYGKEETLEHDAKWLAKFPDIRTFYCEHLHAKCYLNEDQAIITSMNLYEYAQQNNWETGILVLKKEDNNLFEEIQKGIREILQNSTEQFQSQKPIPKTPAVPLEMQRPYQPPAARPANGYCIRCATTLRPPNPQRPYCRAHFRDWEQNHNPYQIENVCYLCGKQCDSTIDKPCCFPCYKKYRHIFEFVI